MISKALGNVLYKRGIFGSISNYWIRIECQNRGSLHSHLLFWLNNPRNDLIRAEITTENDPISTQLRDYV